MNQSAAVTNNIHEILSKLPKSERKLITSLIEKDPLTGVYNLRKFHQDLRLLTSVSDRHNNGCGLLLVDIDDFKSINDQLGHLEGNRILKKVVKSIESIVRNYDKIHIYRYGGDEFIVIMPCTTLVDTFNIGERIRKKIKSTCAVSVSIGVSHYKLLTNTVDELLHTADQALREAKKRGRDKVLTLYHSKGNLDSIPLAKRQELIDLERKTADKNRI